MAYTKPTATASTKAEAQQIEVSKAIAENAVPTMTVVEHSCVSDRDKVINITLENTGAVAIQVPFGGVGSDFTTQSVFQNSQTLLKYFGAESLITNIVSLTDGIDLGAPSLTVINARFLRKSMIISSFEVVGASGDAVLDEQQKSEPLTIVEYPLNFLLARAYSGDFMGQDKEFTAVELVDPSKPIVMGDFKGVFYRLLPGAKVSLNITVSAIDMPSYSAGN